MRRNIIRWSVAKLSPIAPNGLKTRMQRTPQKLKSTL
jgi:hypothetical protein